ncbi:MAG: hypothetical protein R3D05_07950 [Dongiaceae bacterium]
MWPFKRRRAHAKLRAAYTRHLADEVIDELIKGPRPLDAAPQPARLCYILLQVRDDPVEQVPALMSQAIDIIVRRNGSVWGVTSSLALASFGPPFSDDPERDLDQRTKSIARLLTELGPNVRIVYGNADGLLGNCGSANRPHFGPVLPDLARHLAALMALDFGQSAEV